MTIIKKAISGNEKEARVALVDSGSGADLTLDMSHHKIHDGRHWVIKDWRDLTDAASILELLLLYPAAPADGRKPHLLINFSAEAQFQIEFFKTPTITSYGTAIPSHNSNFGSPNTPNLTVAEGAVIAATGDRAFGMKFGTDGGFLSASTGGDARNESEIILDFNQDLLLRATKLTAGDQHINFFFSWYEQKSRN